MKTTMLIFLVLISSLVFSQDTIYYDSYYRVVSSADQYQTYSVIVRNESDSNTAVSETFYRSGTLKSRYNLVYIDRLPQFNGGKIEEWYENGQLQRSYFYKSSISLHGEVVTYHKSGRQKRKDIYDEGVFVRGNIYNDHGMEVPHSDFIIPASFPGGNNALIGYLLKNIKYPPRLMKKEIEGTVQVKFMIDIDGSIKDATIHKSLHDQLDKEAIRVVRKMPDWTPQIFDGESIATYFLLPVVFKVH